MRERLVRRGRGALIAAAALVPAAHGQDCNPNNVPVRTATSTWSQECGIITHHSRDCAVVGFGGAGGALRTGQICDYRNLDLAFDRQETHLLLHPGLLWHQWLGTALQAMGIPKSEYEQPATNPGYPDFKYMDRPGSFDITPEAAYPEIVWSSAGEILPYLGA